MLVRIGGLCGDAPWAAVVAFRQNMGALLLTTAAARPPDQRPASPAKSSPAAPVWRLYAGRAVLRLVLGAAGPGLGLLLFSVNYFCRFRPFCS